MREVADLAAAFGIGRGKLLDYMCLNVLDNKSDTEGSFPSFIADTVTCFPLSAPIYSDRLLSFAQQRTWPRRVTSDLQLFRRLFS